MTESIRYPKLVFLLVIGLVLLAGACSSSDEGAADETSTVGSPSQDDPTKANEDDPTPTATVDGGGGSGPDLGARFNALVGGIENAEYVVSYDVDVESTDGLFEGAMTLYQSPDRTRVDFEIELSGEVLAGTTIDTPDKSYVCIDADGEQTCLEFAGGQSGSPFPNPSEEIRETVAEFEADSDMYSVTPDGSRQIGGTTAECFAIDGPRGTGQVCFSGDGVMLLMQISGPDGTFMIEAKDYRSGVNAADFEPPYPVTTFGS